AALHAIGRIDLFQNVQKRGFERHVAKANRNRSLNFGSDRVRNPHILEQSSKSLSNVRRVELERRNNLLSYVLSLRLDRSTGYEGNRKKCSDCQLYVSSHLR